MVSSTIRRPTIPTWSPHGSRESSQKVPNIFPSSTQTPSLPNTRTQTHSEQSNQAILYETGGVGEMYGFPKVLQGRLQLNVRFPSCWDGKNLDSPDHRSHVRIATAQSFHKYKLTVPFQMSYPDPTKGDTQGGMCPSTHPIALLHIGGEFGFNTDALNITDSSTLVFSMGDTMGYGGHADFIQGWEDLSALGSSFDNCNGFGDACAWNSFGTPDGKAGVKSDMDPEIPAVYEEEIGLNGPVAKLPGDNTVWDGVVSALSTARTVLPLPSPSTLMTLTLTTSPVIATVLPTTLLPSTLLTLPTSSPTSSIQTPPISTPTSISLDPLITQEPSTSSSQSPSSTSTSTRRHVRPTPLFMPREQYEKWLKWIEDLSDDVLDEISGYM